VSREMEVKETDLLYSLNTTEGSSRAPISIQRDPTTSTGWMRGGSRRACSYLTHAAVGPHGAADDSLGRTGAEPSLIKPPSRWRVVCHCVRLDEVCVCFEV
jgi:hypothetical protein